MSRVIVVEEDIDIYDPEAVEWAILTRATAERAISIMQSENGLPTLDKWGIDVTAPVADDTFGKRWLYKKAVPPSVAK